MSGEQQDLDRNDPASDFKLEKARRRGSIAKAQEAGFAFLLLVAVGLIHTQSLPIAKRFGVLVTQALAMSSSATGERTTMLRLSWILFSNAALAMAAVLAILWLAGFGFGALQAHGVFSTEPLKPDFNRLSPATNLKRLFSLRALYDSGRIGLKLVVLGLSAFVWGLVHAVDLLVLSGMPALALLHRLIDLLGSLLTTVAATYAGVASIDWMYSRWEFQRQMRMSKREVKDEHKEREGDPRIRARLRELRAEWAKRAKSVRKVGAADVLLTNPTHVAVALEYRHGEMPAPRLLAKGSGELARRMREEARRRQVPVVQNPPLARALFAEVGQDAFIPEHHFTQVARILRWVYAARRQAGGVAV